MPRTTDGIANDRETTTPGAAAPRTGPRRPVKLHRPDVALTDKYLLEQGTVFLSGTQALVRILLDQVRADRRRGLRTATFVSGYQGSPLGTVDKEILGLGEIAPRHDLHFTAGLNEELAATAVYGSQMAPSLPGARVDGVTGVWYGKNPGLDRAMDALRHANFAGTHPRGGALALVGDDPSCKSSTLPSAGEATLAALHMPTFFPGTLQEVLDFGAHAIACSRASGLWSALKIVTNIADAAGTVAVWPERVGPVIPTVEHDGRPYVHAPDGNLLAPASMELERTLFGPRTEIARQYAALNQLNPQTVPTRDAWLGVVAAGKVYYELVEALHGLGLDQRALERAGIRLMKVGMLYPHDRDAFRSFARGLDEVLVVEEKLPFLETALRDALYGTPDAPRIVGKRDEHDAPLLSPESDLDADAIAVALASRLRAGGRGAPDSVDARVALIEARRATIARTPATLARTPMFCSGCPHNTSTANPDDTLLGAGIGCHTMILLSPEGKGTITGITQMGGEGAQFVGMQDFTDDRHFVQNVGDGTFHHSASLAIRFAVASRANITYKLLYNRTVAMTGGQDIVGGMTVPELTRWLALEGVGRVIITTEDTKRYKKAGLDPIAEVRHRDRLPEAQAELARTPGVTVLLHDQHCAAELRRARKRGKAPEPAQRVEIDERVCEGCGDCGTKSNCMSVLPVETEFGRKTQIHQSSCNKDFSCLKGDCPSFLTVVPAKRRAGAKAPTPAGFPLPPRDALPDPAPKVPRDDFLMRMPGVGGTGVVTVSQILQMAAMLDGKHSYGLDQTGLAQKGGPVVSDVRIARDPIEGSNKASAGAADLLLGFDVLGAANPRNLLVADPARTVAVVNTHATPTAAMVTDTGVRFPARDRNIKAIEAATRAGEDVFFDAEALSIALFGDHMPTNTLLIGAAYQAGCLPLSADALEQAIRLNGAAVEKNLAAFAWGRAVVAAPEAVAAATSPERPEAVRPALEGAAAAIVEAAGTTGELRRLLEVRVPELIAYGGVALAREYAQDVVRVAAAEAAKGAPGETAVAEAYARGLHKLLAYKDEYEVARLHLEGLAARDAADGKVSVMLHPPLLRAMGLDHKVKLRRGVAVPLFKALRATNGLRGTRLDPFGRAHVRRIERALPGEYQALVDRALERLTPVTHATVAAIADLPDLVRGYEDVKLANVEAFRQRAARLEDELARGAQSGGFTLPVIQG
ncbi:MAG TPA: indolepyruvate ferredoxin oxidoreductase family protein [Baekduia sp.]|uniref:indolepyruvate ferredoxin oxidoreductase family protein n=1 Tax=Baekduia sp. TaxID=2600305 RepID=UPI002D7A2A89|nr:indolepyruvate ferredoxin oxidoreductase family protein [Baekduia sp.]HET6506520.1 indolepyruvate ferredoxin oxidoreductase family protein [Baekduia sp.]